MEHKHNMEAQDDKGKTDLTALDIEIEVPEVVTVLWVQYYMLWSPEKYPKACKIIFMNINDLSHFYIPGFVVQNFDFCPDPFYDDIPISQELDMI